MADKAKKTINQTNSKAKSKKSYESPSWEIEQVFEKTALTCVKADEGQCAAGPIQS